MTESTYCYDFVTYSYGCCSVEGGLDYLMRCCKHSQEEDFIDFSETIETGEICEL